MSAARISTVPWYHWQYTCTYHHSTYHLVRTGTYVLSCYVTTFCCTYMCMYTCTIMNQYVWNTCTYMCTIIDQYLKKYAHVCAYVRTYVRTYTCTIEIHVYVLYHLVMLCHNFLLMCTENHMCFGRIHGSQLREGANAGQHTPSLSLPPSHHRRNGEVYCRNRHAYNDITL
jgi:hypothetical protein